MIFEGGFGGEWREDEGRWREGEEERSILLMEELFEKLFHLNKKLEIQVHIGVYTGYYLTLIILE